MVLCAGNDDHTAVELLRPDESKQILNYFEPILESKIGERVTLEGYDKISQEPEKVIDPKKKILETVLPHLKTDSEGYATFQGKKLKTSAGFIKAKSLKNCPIS